MTNDGFLSRWSQRKRERQTQELAPQVEPKPGADELTNTSTGGHLEAKMPETARQSDTSSSAVAAPAPLPAVDSLTGASDFSPFMSADVAPELRNQAMKKLFADPRYNIMDGLDTYIDDYGKPDPLPAGWLEQMQQSKSLRLFETPEEKQQREAENASAEAQAVAAASANQPTPETSNTADASLAATDSVATLPVDTAPPAPSPSVEVASNMVPTKT
jgi:hypothetical protein